MLLHRHILIRRVPDHGIRALLPGKTVINTGIVWFKITQNDQRCNLLCGDLLDEGKYLELARTPQVHRA